MDRQWIAEKQTRGAEVQPLGHLPDYYSFTTIPIFSGYRRTFPSLSIDYTQPIFQYMGFQVPQWVLNR
jgi:hypothetical protein